MPDAGARLGVAADLLAFEGLASPALEAAVQLRARQAQRGPPRLDARSARDKAREVSAAVHPARGSTRITMREVAPILKPGIRPAR